MNEFAAKRSANPKGGGPSRIKTGMTSELSVAIGEASNGHSLGAADLRKREVVRDVLMQRLTNGKYRFGQSLSVKELGAELGLSRQPIMAALNTIAAEGLVEVVPQVGCLVASPTVQQIEDFFVMVGQLEGMMAYMAAQRARPHDLADLLSINQQINALELTAPGVLERYRHLNRRFHECLYALAQSALVQTRIEAMQAMADFFISQAGGLSGHIRSAADQHQQILAALSCKDAAAARVAAEHHVEASAKLVIAGLRLGGHA